MGTRRIIALAALIAVLVGGLASTVDAYAKQDSVAGGGSLNGQLVELPQGGMLGAVYSVYYRNDTAHPIRVEFFSEAPVGVVVAPDQPVLDIAPRGTERIYYSVNVGTEAAPGDYTVKTGLRPVVESTSGVEITTAFATEFPLRVTGAGSELTVRARDVARGAPAVGTLAIARIGATGSSMAIAKVDGSELVSLVAPGTYEVTFDLGGKTLTQREVVVGADQPVVVNLDVETVRFDDVRLLRNDAKGSLRTVDVAGIIDNDLGEIPRAETNLVVTRDGEPLETVALKSFAPLPEGLQEVTGRYVPAAGWINGEYAFTLQLLGDELAVHSEQPVILTLGSVPAVAPTGSTSPGGIEPWMVGVAVGVVLMVAFLGLLRRRAW